MVIIVRDLVDSCTTFEEGETLRDAIVEALSRIQSVTVSFDGVGYATSSFVNGAFVGLLDDLHMEEIKTRMSIVKSHRQINTLVRDLVAYSAKMRMAQ